MAASPGFPITPKIGTGNMTAASTGYGLTLPTNTVTCFTAGVNGAKVRKISVKALVQISSAQIIRIWYYNLTSYFLWKEIAMPTTSAPAAAVKTGEDSIDVDWDIPANHTLVAGNSVAQSTVIIVEGMDN